MATTDVSLCNRALIRLGLKPIAGFNEESDKATTCDTMYPGIRDALLASHPWRFATGKVSLNRLTATPINEWKYAYQLPGTMLAGPYAVFNSSQAGAEPTARFEIFENKLYSDDELVVVDVRVRPAESSFPPLFQELVVYAVAAAIGPVLTDQAKLAIMYQEAAFGTPSENGRGGMFAIAASENATSNGAIAIEDDSLVESRFS